jgi:DNA repair protein RecO (recombination protein O)
MEWRAQAIILKVRRSGEHAAVVQLLAHGRGVWSAVCKSAFGKSKRGIHQPGNLVEARFRARSEAQMGYFECEPLRPTAGLVMHDALRLAALASATALASTLLSEREWQPAAYDAMERLMLALTEESASEGNDAPRWLAAYARLELALLECAGFGLDLSRCAATGATESLIYVSPRSGRAVCEEAGAPWRDRLFPLPAFLREQANWRDASSEELRQALRLCGHFLQERCFAPQERHLPLARTRLAEMMEKFLEPV